MKLNKVKKGDIIIADGGFTCLQAVEHKVYDNEGLFIECEQGMHFLDGQLDDDGNLIGLSK